MPAWPRVRTVSLVRSARNRSCEVSNGHAVLVDRDPVIDSSGAPSVDAEDLPLVRGRRTPPRCFSSASAGRTPYCLLEQLVQRAAQRLLQQAGEPLGREPRVLQRDRRAVGEPDPHDVEHERAPARAAAPERSPRPPRPLPALTTLRPGRQALLAQQRRHAHDPGQVPVDLLRRHERAAAATRHPAYDARRPPARRAPAAGWTGSRRTPTARSRSAPSRCPGLQLPAADLLEQPAADLVGRRADRAALDDPGGHLRCPQTSAACMASSDSGSTWPPSTTSVWPVT